MASTPTIPYSTFVRKPLAVHHHTQRWKLKKFSGRSRFIIGDCEKSFTLNLRDPAIDFELPFIKSDFAACKLLPVNTSHQAFNIPGGRQKRVLKGLSI
jgi:hypothetical protein